MEDGHRELDRLAIGGADHDGAGFAAVVGGDFFRPDVKGDDEIRHARQREGFRGGCEREGGLKWARRDRVLEAGAGGRWSKGPLDRCGGVKGGRGGDVGAKAGGVGRGRFVKAGSWAGGAGSEERGGAWHRRLVRCAETGEDERGAGWRTVAGVG